MSPRADSSTGKRILVTGVLTDASLAFAVARLAQAEGAEVVLSGAGRGLSLTRRTARKLDPPADVIEIDVTDPDQLRAAADDLAARWGRLDGILHAIGFAPQECLGGDILARRLGRGGRWPSRSRPTRSRRSSARCRPSSWRPAEASSVVGLDFDATVAWPAYDWMGVAKAALESLARYLARDLGPARHPGQPGGGRAGAHHGGQVDPGLQRLRGHLGRPGPARLGRQRLRRPWPGPAWRCCRTGSP